MAKGVTLGAWLGIELVRHWSDKQGQYFLSACLEIREAVGSEFLGW